MNDFFRELILNSSKDFVLESAVGLGLVFNLIFSEFFGLAAGGLIVPGYVAFHLHYPLSLLTTLAVSLVAYIVIKFLSNFMFIYSRRLLMFSILFGFLFGWFTSYYIVPLLTTKVFPQLYENNIEIQAIGMIIPGLITYWMHKQGILRTLSMLIVAAVAVRLILILAFGGENIFLLQTF